MTLPDKKIIERLDAHIETTRALADGLKAQRIAQVVRDIADFLDGFVDGQQRESISRADIARMQLTHYATEQASLDHRRHRVESMLTDA